MKFFLAMLFSALFLLWTGVRIAESVILDRSCIGYLERAASANTVNLAEQNLATAVKYLDANHLTSGYTSILYTTPDADVSFWYGNLKASLEELQTVRPDATMLERSNILIKLRETLIHHGSNGESVIAPEGLSIFPYNTIFMLWGVLSFVLAVIFWILFADE